MAEKERIRTQQNLKKQDEKKEPEEEKDLKSKENAISNFTFNLNINLFQADKPVNKPAGNDGSVFNKPQQQIIDQVPNKKRDQKEAGKPRGNLDMVSF